MIKIAFCDDDPSALNEIRVLLDKYRVERNQDINYVSFHNPLDLLADIERGTRYDVLFLDVLMPGENGIDTAAEIRNYDTNVKIIFLTSSAEFAVDSYAVGAYFYQLKPIWEDSFFRLMDSVLAECEKQYSQSLILRCKSGITRVDLMKLEYCEVLHRTLFIHMADGQVLETNGCLDELTQQLQPYGNFLRVHRSYLINLDYVQKISFRAVAMCCGTDIPIPRGKYNEIKEAFLNHAFQNRQVMI